MEYLAQFFQLNITPIAFIVDDLDFIIKQRRKQTDRTYISMLSRVFALLVDNVEHFRSISDQKCELLVATSFDPNIIEEFVVMKSVAEHFFDQIYTVKERELLGSTCKGFEIVSNDETYKITFKVQDDLIKLQNVLKKKE